MRTVKSYNGYFVNGYKFHTEAHAENKSTTNSGLCISSPFGDYYGNLLEILEVEYPGYPIKTTILFKCHWYDPTPNVGVKVHKQYNLVDINKNKQYNKFEPFILAMQSTQVCYMSYPSLKQNNSEWFAVFKVKPRGWTDARESDQQKDIAFQEDDVDTNEIMDITQQAVEYGDLSNSGSENESNDDNDGDCDDENNHDSNDDDAATEDDFEYSTSDNEEEDNEEEDEFYDSD